MTKLFIAASILVAFLALVAQGAPEPKAEKTKGNLEEVSNASQSRLFNKKFPHFNNFFGNKNQQQYPQPMPPIIIITGGSDPDPGTGTGSGPGTGTGEDPGIDGTVSVPSATGTVTTEEEAEQPDPADPTDPKPQNDDDSFSDDDVHEDGEDDEAAEHPAPLRSSYSPSFEQYVIRTGDVEESSNGKASAQPFRVDLRSVGGRRGQTITVNIPLKYKRFFQNGQKVTLSTQNGGNRRRVNRKRGNKNNRKKGNNKNKNKKNRNTRIITI